MTTKFIVTRNEKTIWRERGFSAGEFGRPKQTDNFPSAEAEGAYLLGYRLGRQAKARRAE